jgi:Trypsin-like peptidase domain
VSLHSGRYFLDAARSRPAATIGAKHTMLGGLAFCRPRAYLSIMSIRAPGKSKNWRGLTLCLVIIFFEPPMISARAAGTPDPWIVVPDILRGKSSAPGVYLKPGLVITAAHVVNWGSGDTSVRIDRTVLPARVVKQSFDEVDLAVFSIDEQKLPERVLRTHTPLCQAPPWPGDPVIVVDQARVTRSHIISPQILPFTLRDKFHTLIADVASTGNSGSGVFNPDQKCLLGIISRKFMMDGKDIAKYFIPAGEIRDFIPNELREQVPVR